LASLQKDYTGVHGHQNIKYFCNSLNTEWQLFSPRQFNIWFALGKEQVWREVVKHMK